jgi:hypothetical protein
MTPPLRSPQLRIVAIGVAVLLPVGVYVGLRVPWGTKHPQVKEGIAMRANTDNDLVLFDAKDGTQLALHADGLWWESENVGGEGNPPCLTKPGERVDVEVGIVTVAGPTGGSRSTGVWLKCL